MNKIIPKDQIKHLMWSTEQEVPKTISDTNTPKKKTNQVTVLTNEILNGREFYNNDEDGGKYIGVMKALEEGLNFVGTNGFIVTMPELIATKVVASKTHDLWNKWYTAHTEENIGIDRKGRFYGGNEPVLVVVNGGGLLTPERIKKAYVDGLVGNSAKYTQEEFDNLLEGIVANGDEIPLYKYEDVLENPALPHRFGIVMKYSVAQSTFTDYFKEESFIENPLVIARAGGSQYLKEYHSLAKYSDGEVRNSHIYNGRDPSEPSGRLLYLYSVNYGLSGYIDLNNYGRFLGVAPEARAKK
jgi:hypothetical protein